MDTRKRIYHVEVQRLRQRHAGTRLLYYLTHHFERQLKKGGWYGDLHRTVTLAILDFNLFPDEPGGIHLLEICTSAAGIPIQATLNLITGTVISFSTGFVLSIISPILSITFAL
jgi:hypothetical protein